MLLAGTLFSLFAARPLWAGDSKPASAKALPSPEEQEGIAHYRQRVKRLGFDVSGTSASAGDGCVENTETVIFPDRGVEQVFPIGLKLLFRDADGYLKIIAAPGKPGTRQENAGSGTETVTRDAAGRVVKIIEGIPGDPGMESTTEISVDRTKEGGIQEVRVEGSGGDGSWSGSIKSKGKGSVTVSFSGTQC